MNRVLKQVSLVQSNTYSLKKDIKLVFNYICVDSDGNGLDQVYDSFRAMTNDLLDTDIGMELNFQYLNALDSSFEFQSSAFNEDEYKDFVSDNFKRVTEELGYRVITIIK